MRTWKRFLIGLTTVAWSVTFVSITPADAVEPDSFSNQDRITTPDQEKVQGADRVVTAQQQELELMALKLLNNPVAQQAKILAGRNLRNFVGVEGEDDVFNAALGKIAFCGALMAVNSDANFPKIHAQAVPAHRVNGIAIADSTCGIPDPDTIYRFIPVDGVSHYVIVGQVAKHRPIENNFTLAAYNMTTIDNLNGRDLQVDPDGHFTITVGPEPANGRPNHLQSRHDAFQIWIRDTLGDWSKERPNRLSVRRVDKSAGTPVGPDGEMAMLGHYISYTVQSMPAYVINGPANTFRNPQILSGAAGTASCVVTRDYGFLVTQEYSNGRFDLKDDEALLLTLKMGFARYAVVPVMNMWGTNDGVSRTTGSLNNFQAQPNADGTYTFVVSKKDPAVFNWVDTGGLNQGTLYLRWAGFPSGDLSNREAPSVTTSVVKLHELDRLLPAARRIDAEGRKQQLQKHAEERARRQLDD